MLGWKIDRFGRSALDLLANIRHLADAGVRFISVTQGLDIKPDGDPMSRLMLAMLSAVSEFELDIMGLSAARKRGKTLGRPRSPRPPQERAVALREAGKTWPQIAKDLDGSVWAARQAVKTGG